MTKTSSITTVLTATPESLLTATAGVRPHVRGKFIFTGDERFYVRGVTYGPFRPSRGGSEYHTPDVVDWDFELMAANGVNAVRTYTVPPRWLLDAAERHGLYVMVGLPWEQHITFLEDKGRAADIEERVRAGIRACADHPAVLCYTIGNEIPAPIVRWHGRGPVEHFLRRLYRTAKAEDPNALVTYVNYPTTEYLQLPFLDFFCFNVYLERQQDLESYLARLQNIAGERPLVMAEIGLDSRRHGEDAQADVLDWQVRTAFEGGCAGTFVFAWTDEWHRGGYDIKDWDFGVTDRDRQPKPALVAVRKAYAEVPFPSNRPWPRISVIVCTHNGSRTIRDCCEGLLGLDYPDFEVIVVNDGSNDRTAATVSEYDFRLINTEKRGLSSARNTGMEAATGEIVAYIDDDAYPDPDWLTYLASTFMCSEHVGVGGPNIPPPGDGPIANCVANAPGGPVHILISDREAEHIPGCNMAFRKPALEAIGGFDPQFHAAGDDVDVCWRLQERGWTLGFSPAAVVWHHRRNSVKAYWKQQMGYGKAEALLETKWPEKYNRLGHLTWQGRLYGQGLSRVLPFRRWRVYHGVWGSAPFQSIYEAGPSTLLSLPMMPEWYLLVGALLGLSLLGVFWRLGLLALPLFTLALGALVIQAVSNVVRASFPDTPARLAGRLKLYSLTAFLHLLQPLARLTGRLRYGLTPWRRRGVHHFAFPRPQMSEIWSECWQAPEERLSVLEASLREHGAAVIRGGTFDRWDLEIRGGLFGAVRVLMAVEEHGGGAQLVRLRAWPRLSPPAQLPVLASMGLAGAAAVDQVWGPFAIFVLAGILHAVLAFGDCAAATASYLEALDDVWSSE